MSKVPYGTTRPRNEICLYLKSLKSIMDISISGSSSRSITDNLQLHNVSARQRDSDGHYDFVDANTDTFHLIHRIGVTDQQKEGETRGRKQKGSGLHGDAARITVLCEAALTSASMGDTFSLLSCGR